ncbi:hypothetical protein BH10CYA1_BH10CYA1_50650 [soil metagenome]
MTVDFQRDVFSTNCHPNDNATSTPLLDQACKDAYQPKEKSNCSTPSKSPVFDMCSWRPDYSLSTQSARDWAKQSDINRTKPIELTKCDIYTVKYGDCLWTIAERDLKKNGEKHDAGAVKDEIANIVKLNQKDHPSLKCNPDLILPGWKLKMPDHCKDTNTDSKPPEKPPVCHPPEKPPEQPPVCPPPEQPPVCPPPEKPPEQPKPPCPPEKPPEQPKPPCPPEN